MEETEDISNPVPIQTQSGFVVKTSRGKFVTDAAQISKSSRRKKIFYGTYTAASGEVFAAVALVFETSNPSFYGGEVSSLARNAFLGVGPEVFESLATVNFGDGVRPVIIEEDAGVSLEAALFEGVEVPGTVAHPEYAAPLHCIGTHAREAENAKILFDIYSQVNNMHSAGIFHRDIRSSNICLRRFGALPQDIHATLIDHELATSFSGSDINASAKHYAQILFEDFPLAINPAYVSRKPSSLERDLGYLAAISFELRTSKSIDYASPSLLACGKRPYFTYAADGKPVIHMLNLEEDIIPLAQECYLIPADEEHFFEAHLLDYIRTNIKHSGFVDAKDLLQIKRQTNLELDSSAKDIAENVLYNSWVEERLRQGTEIDYDNFEDQPQLLQESSYNQVRNISSAVKQLGYRIVPTENLGSMRAVKNFSIEEIEYLAYLEHERWVKERVSNGWIYGKARDDERRIHPDILPYDQLSEDAKEYDRLFAYKLIDILASKGLSICR